MTVQQAALDLAALGIPVLPLHGVIELPKGGLICGCGTSRCSSPAKHPIAGLAPKGLKHASADEAIVRDWWRLSPAANIGIATGSLIVLDIDPRHGGDATL